MPHSKLSRDFCHIFSTWDEKSSEEPEPARKKKKKKKKGDKKIPSLILSIEANAISVFDLIIYIMNQGKFFTLLI